MNRSVEGRFQLLSHIGDGGMASVSKVMDRSTGRICALKVSNVPFEESDRERLIRECSIWFELRHIGQVVEVYEIVSTELEDFAIVMEYVEGGDLRRYISDWSFGIEDRLLALYDIACALLKCSQEMPGFAHLDIKPSNCLRTFHGLSKLSDFGLASTNVTNISHAGGSVKTANGRNSLIIRTNEGPFNVGTPLYMAPEQILACCDNGAKADVYSFGIMALELLSGKHPVDSDEIDVILRSHLKGIPKRNRKWPRELSRTLMGTLDCCLEIRPENRPQISEFVSALRKSLFSSSIYETFAASDMKRWPDPVDDAIRKARSLRSLGQKERALSVLLRTLEEDPFQADCWVQAAKWKIEMAAMPLEDSVRQEVINWCLRASLLTPKKNEERMQELSEMIVSVTPKDGLSPVSMFSQRLKKMSQDQKAWLKTKEKNITEEGCANASLCVRCGELRSTLVKRCPKCGFFPTDMRDIYDTYLLRVSNMNPHMELPYHERMELLRELGDDIDNTVKKVESSARYAESLRDFSSKDGRFLQALALGKSYKEISKISQAVYGTRAPNLKDMEGFVKHIKGKTKDQS